MSRTTCYICFLSRNLGYGLGSVTDGGAGAAALTLGATAAGLTAIL